MTETTPDQLPLLSVGSHDRGSGNACIMNAISYLQGDLEITDAPGCVYEPFQVPAVAINDHLCVHRVAPDPRLCDTCSHEMWLLGARLIGTAEAVLGWSNEQRQILNARLAIHLARQVLGCFDPEHRPVYQNLLLAMQGWCDGLTDTPTVRTLYGGVQSLCFSVDRSLHEIFIETALIVLNTCDDGAGEYLLEQISSSVAYRLSIDCRGRLEVLHGLIDEFERLTATKSPGFTADAYEQVAREAALIR